MSGTSLLRRLVAGLGLMLMIPIAVQLIEGTVTPSDAGMRAGILLAGVMVFRKLVSLMPSGPAVLLPAPDAAQAPPESENAA